MNLHWTAVLLSGETLEKPFERTRGAQATLQPPAFTPHHPPVGGEP